MIMNKFKGFYWLFILLVINGLYGCMSMQSKSVVYLNPDMSGKCTYEIKMGKDLAGILTDPSSGLDYGLGLSGGSKKKEKKSPGDPALALASKILSSGTFDTWKDVQFGYKTKDTVFFTGTAYFKDITHIAVSMFDSNLTVHHDADGNTVMEITTSKKKDTASANPNTTNAAYDSISKAAYKDVGISDIMHYYFASLVRGLYISTTYHLPGKIVSSSNFKKLSDNTISLTITGDDVIKLMDTLSGKSDYTSMLYGKYYGLANGGSNAESYFYDKVLYGEEKPIMVVFKTETKPAFDYAKEVADAKVYYAKYRKSSGIEKYDSLAAAEKKEAEEEKAKEEGTLVLTAKDSANGKTYFKTLTATQYSGSVSFSGILSKPQSGVSFTKVKITKATADNGVNVTDSIGKQNNYYGYDSTSVGYLSAYLTNSNGGYGYGDSNTQYDKATFTMYINLPDNIKYVNLEGLLIIDENRSIPFKLDKLYIKNNNEEFKEDDWK
jgi:hypothetical protein